MRGLVEPTLVLMATLPFEPTVHRFWHAIGAEEALDLLAIQKAGLDRQEVLNRRKIFGENVLPKPKPVSVFTLYLRQFKSPLIFLLLIAAAVSLTIQEFSDAGFIFAVLQINAIIGAVQEWRAGASAEALHKMIPLRVIVQREGMHEEIESHELVPGDIVLLEAGATVPADLRLLWVKNLRLDESLLTGESLPIEKTAELALPEATPLGDRRNMLHAGSTVLDGRAEAIVTQTGQHTEIGRIARALEAEAAAVPPLMRRLETFTYRIGGFIIFAVIALAVVEALRGVDPAQIFFMAVALVVSAIPEGLPVAITVALSVGMARMARRNVIVRSLPAAEGLGVCTKIASDKTGTLTLNELTIKRVLLPGIGEVEVAGEGYVPEGAVTSAGGPLADEAAATLQALATAGGLCNEGGLYATEDGYHHAGDTVDVAFLVLAGKLGLTRQDLLSRLPERDLVPFEPSRRFAASFNEANGRTIAHLKGAAEVIVPMCTGVDGTAVLAEVDRLAGDGYRVLAVAAGEVAKPDPAFLQGLRFLGIVALIDPLRPEVPEAIRRCQRAGVEVCMITGDHPATALTIARELGFATRPEEVLTGAELASLAAEPFEMDLAVRQAKVFARVEPVQKLAIVQSLQRAGHVVAVTGDGVNDAPALRAADIGAAMGKKGTDVARDAADLIITDDNFASVVDGIEEGRIAFDNIRKVIYLLVSTGAAEIALFALSLAAGLPLPLFAAQLLWLNLITNGVQHVALAFEKGEPGVLDRPPRAPTQRIFDSQMIEQSVISGAYIGIVGFGFFWWATNNGWDEFVARNALLLLMVLFENVHVFNCRSERRSSFRVPLFANPLLVLSVLMAQAIHIGAMYVPGLNDVLEIAPLPAETWWRLAPLAVGLLLMMEIYKFFKGLTPARAV